MRVSTLIDVADESNYVPVDLMPSFRTRSPRRSAKVEARTPRLTVPIGHQKSMVLEGPGSAIVVALYEEKVAIIRPWREPDCI